MSFYDALKKHNILLQNTETFTRPGHLQMACPQVYCKNDRPVGSESTLRVDILPPQYAEWRCGHCLWSGHIGERPAVQEVKSEEPKPTDKPPVDMPPEAWEYLSRWSLSSIEASRYRLSWDGRKKSIRVPYYEGEKIVNNLFIRVSDGKGQLEIPDRATFYGLEKVGRNSEPIVICQRELDAIVLMERGILNVISIPNGGNVPVNGNDFNNQPDKFAYLSAVAEKVKDWAGVKFAFDDTKEALALRQELARRIGPGICSSATLTKGTIADTYRECGADMLCEDIANAKDLPIHGLFKIDAFERELKAYFEYGMNSGVNTGWKNVDKLYSVVPGQLTVVTGIPNSGKSEWVDALSMNLAEEFNWRIAAFSPENGKEAHATKLIEKRVMMSADPKASRRMSYDTFMSGAEWVNNHYSFIESKDEMPSLDWILERAKDAALRYGIKGLIIDPWNRIEKKLADRQSETDYVAASIPKILRFLGNYGVHGWLVVHPKQQQPDPRTGKIRAPSLYDMAGSAHFVNMCDNGIVINRSDSIDDTTEVLVRKVRFKHVGRRGETKLRYDRNTGRYEPLDEEFTPSQKNEAEKYKAASNGDVDAIITYEPEE